MSVVGFVVRGVSSSAFVEAKEKAQRRFDIREKQREEAKAAGLRMPRKIKLKEIKPERMYHAIVFGPTTIESAAADAVELAKRSGYLDVRMTKAEDE